MLEIAILVYAVIVLIRGKFSLSSGREITGWRARLCGGILLGHLPLTFILGMLMGILGIMKGGDGEMGMALGLGFGSLVLVVVIALVTGNALYKGQVAEEQARRNPPPMPPPANF